MPTRSSNDHNFSTVALSIVEQAIGEKGDGYTVERGFIKTIDRPKNPAAVALGKLGGQKGGKARAAALTAEQR